MRIESRHFCRTAVAFFLLFPANIAIAADAVGIHDFLRLALDKSETKGINQSQLDQFSAKRDQVASTIMPQIKVLGSYTRQDVSNNKNLDAHSTAARLNATQTLLGLYKNKSALAAADKQLESIDAGGHDAVLQLKFALNDAFHDVLTASGDVKNYVEVKSLTGKRVAEISSRVKIGRSRVADLYTAKAQLATSEAQLEQAKTNESKARNALAQLSGLSASLPFADVVQLPSQLDDVDDYLLRVEELPSIRSLKLQQELIDLQVASTRLQRLPDLDLFANYYLHREAPLDQVKWDVGLQLTVPLYDGGLISAKLHEATANTKELTYELQQKRRVIDLRIRQVYEELSASMRLIGILKNSLDLAQKSYDTIEKDYRLGLSTVLDVFQAFNAVAEAKRQYHHQIIIAKSTWIALQLNTGKV